MLVPWLFLAAGAALTALIAVWQIKLVPPAFIPVCRYNLLVLPLFYLANVATGAGLLRWHEAIKNLPLLVAGQAFMYYTFLVVFSLLWLDDRISPGRSLVGLLLIAAGVALLGN